jgi:hypothetical protein
MMFKRMTMVAMVTSLVCTGAAIGLDYTSEFTAGNNLDNWNSGGETVV